ncbi:PLDc N-terminal domain-containing protein [Nocardioides endophyticus]|uniref:PLDc N-terminal domain-containing protein n=1 Tax=Nocardioides endophyticus TaxID=1353775 RepID=UPI003CD07BFC
MRTRGWVAHQTSGHGSLDRSALYLIDLALKIVALGVVPKNRRPSSGMAWLLLILVLPIFGWVIFLALGRTKIGRRRNEQQAEVNELVAERTAHVPTLEDDFPGPAYVRSVATLNRNLGAQPAMRQPGRPVPGLSRVDRCDDRGDRQGHQLGARRVLHHCLGRRHRVVLRGAGAGRRNRDARRRARPGRGGDGDGSCGQRRVRGSTAAAGHRSAGRPGRRGRERPLGQPGDRTPVGGERRAPHRDPRCCPLQLRLGGHARRERLHRGVRGRHQLRGLASARGDAGPCDHRAARAASTSRRSSTRC